MKEMLGRWAENTISFIFVVGVLFLTVYFFGGLLRKFGQWAWG